MGHKKDEKNANNLPLKNPSHPFPGPTTPPLCQLPPRAGRRDRFGTRRNRPVGTLGSYRVALAADQSALCPDPPPRRQKLPSGEIMTDIIRDFAPLESFQRLMKIGNSGIAPQSRRF